MKHAIAACLAAALLAAAPAALAEQWSGSYSPSLPKRSKGIDNIGNAGQFVFGVERVTGLFFDRDWTDYDDAGTAREVKHSTTSFGLFGMGAASNEFGAAMPSELPRLALDYLVTDGVSVGGSLIYVRHARDVSANEGGSVQDTDLGSASTFVLNPRAGYAFPFDETFGIWPRAGIAYANRSGDADVDDGSGGSVSAEWSTSTWQLTLDAMLVVSPFEHFAILAGPYLDVGLGGGYEEKRDGEVFDERNAKLTSFGLHVGLSGYY